MEFHMKLAGVTFENRQQVLQKLKEGEELKFVAEPTNPYDNHAVKVVRLDGTQVGYIPRAQNSTIFNNLMTHNGTYKVYVSAITGGGMDFMNNWMSMGCNIRVVYNY